MHVTKLPKKVLKIGWEVHKHQDCWVEWQKHIVDQYGNGEKTVLYYFMSYIKSMRELRIFWQTYLGLNIVMSSSMWLKYTYWCKLLKILTSSSFRVINFWTQWRGMAIDKMYVTDTNINHAYNLELTSHRFARKGNSKYA